MVSLTIPVLKPSIEDSKQTPSQMLTIVKANTTTTKLFLPKDKLWQSYQQMNIRQVLQPKKKEYFKYEVSDWIWFPIKYARFVKVDICNCFTSLSSRNVFQFEKKCIFEKPCNFLSIKSSYFLIDKFKHIFSYDFKST